MENIVNCLAGLFELQLWLIFVQPFRIIQYILRLLRLDAVAKVVGYIAYPACYIIIVLESFRDTFGDDNILAIVPQALGLRAQYHIKGPNEDIMYNSNPLCNSLTAHCYCAKGNYDQAKKLYLKSLCLFSWFLLITQISGKKKRVSKYRGTIDQLYNEKKYSELVSFYEGKPKMQEFATSQHVRKYIFSLWYSGNTKKALKLANDNKKGDKDTRFDELLARDCENRGDLKKAAEYFRSAKLDAEEKRILDIIDDQEREVAHELEKQYNNKEYAKVIEIFEKNDYLAKRYNGEKIVSQYICSIHATAGVSKTLVSAIEQYSKNTNNEWERWQAEYYENQGDFVKAAEHYKLAGQMEDYKRMLDKEEERKRIEEEKRIAREKAAAQECEAKGEFLNAAEHYKAAGMIADHQRMLDKEEERKRIEEEKRIARETEEAKQLEASGQYGAAAKKFKVLGLTADYERTNKKDYDQRISQLKEKIKNEYKNKAYGDVITNAESDKELLEDIDIVNCYLWALWRHNGTEDKAVELIKKYAQIFNTTRWESILGHYYAWKKNYAEAIKHYRIAGMEDEIKKMEDKIREQEEEERRRKEEEERRKREEAEKAIEKFRELIAKAIENKDSDYCNIAYSYLEDAGIADEDTKTFIENIKNAIYSLKNNEYSEAIDYFRRAGLSEQADQLETELEYSSYGYSPYGSSSGCSGCTSQCSNACGRGCQGSCGDQCRSGCSGACSVGRNKRKH